MNRHGQAHDPIRILIQRSSVLPTALGCLGGGLRSRAHHEPWSCVLSWVLVGVLGLCLALHWGRHRAALTLVFLCSLMVMWGNYARLLLLFDYKLPEHAVTRKRDIVYWITSLLTAIGHQGYARDTFPGLGVRLLLAEGYTLLKWAAMTWGHTCLESEACTREILWKTGCHNFVMLHATGVLLPLLMFPPLRQQTHPSAPADESSPPRGTPCSSATPSVCSCSRDHSTQPEPKHKTLQQLHGHPQDQCATKSWFTAATIQQLRAWLVGHGGMQLSTDYQSPMGCKVPITVKINTHHSPQLVSTSRLNDLAQQLQDLMSQTVANTGSRLQVLGAAVRYGCILISMDAYQAPTGNSSAAPTGSGSVSRDEVLQLARELLPSLLGQLGLPDKGPDLEQLDDSWQLRLQVGPHLVTAACDRATLEWQFEVVDAPAEQLSDMPSIHLAQPCPATVQPPTDQAAPDGHHLVSFTVRCAGVVGPVQGSDPDATNQPQASSQSALKLWVQSQGQYLKTMSVTRQPSQPDLLHVTVQLPSTALSRHHQPGGPVARLQLLDVGLWTAADVWLSSTPLLLDVVQHLHPAVASGSIRNWGWWGGLDVHRVPQLLQELAHMTALAAQQSANNAGLGHSAQQQHEQLMQNLAAWLKVVQQAAPSTCCDMVPSTDSITHCVAPQRLAATAQALLQHTAACGMRTTHAVVKAQQLLVQPDDPSRHSRPYTYLIYTYLIHTLHSLDKAVFGGSSCTACDTLYLARLHSRLPLGSVVFGPLLVMQSLGLFFICAPVRSPMVRLCRVALSALRIAFITVLSIQPLIQPPCGSHSPAEEAVNSSRAASSTSSRASPTGRASFAFTSSTSSSHRGCESSSSGWQTHTVRRRRTADRPGPGWLSMLRLSERGEVRTQVIAWLLHLCIEGLVALGITPLKASKCGTGSVQPFTALHALFITHAHQVPIWGRVPDALVRALVVVETVLHSRCAKMCPKFPLLAKWWYVPSTFVVPWLVDKYWRRLMRRGPQAGQDKQHRD